MVIELKLITDILGTPDKEGNQKIIKKDVVFKK